MDNELISKQLLDVVTAIIRASKRTPTPGEEPPAKHSRGADTLQPLGEPFESFHLTPNQLRAITRDGVLDRELFLLCTEDELIQRYEFTYSQCLQHRRLVNTSRSEPSSSTDVIPVAGSRAKTEATRSLPSFRGTLPTTYKEADTFLQRFETVLRTFGVPTTQWAELMTMQLHDQHDAQYWQRLLADTNETWTWYRDQFLKHFRHPRLIEAKRNELIHFRQEPNERVQQYSDRFRSTLELADLGDTAASMAVNYYRNGITSSRFRSELNTREPVDEPYTLDTIITTALFIESNYEAEAIKLGRHRDLDNQSREPRPKDHNHDGKKRCIHCRSSRHRSEECPRGRKVLEKPKPTAPAPTKQTCKVCGLLTEHKYWDCPKALCGDCKKTGHIAVNCPTATCETCHKKGHKAARCPENNKSKDRSYSEDMLRSLRKGYPPDGLDTMENVQDYMTLPVSMRKLYSTFSKEDRLPIVVRATEVDPAAPSNQTLIPVRLEGRASIALVDPGSTHSLLSHTLAEELGLTLTPVEAQARSAFSDLSMVNLSVTDHLTLQCGRRTLQQTFFVTQLYDDIILGWDALPALGIGLTGLPVENDVGFLNENSDGIVAEDSLVNDRIDEDELNRLLEGIHDLLEENSRLDPRGFCTYPAAEVALDTGDALPVYATQYKTPYRLVQVVDEQLEAWSETNRIVPSDPLTRWNSPLLVAPKKDLLGNKTQSRVCLDLRRINELIKPDSYGIPRVKDLFEKVSGFRYCSGLDLASAYTQFPIVREDQHKTTFTWRNKKWMFTGAPFGFKHLPSHFQRVFSAILYDCREFVVVYLDDVFIFSKTLEKHILHVRQVISLINKWHLILKISKCGFGYRKLRLLGHILSGNEVTIDPAKVTTFTDLPRPTTGKQVASFLGFAGYLRDYVPKFSTIAAPLEQLKSKKQLGDAWTAECEESLSLLKRVLSQAPTISTYNEAEPLLVSTDASLYGVGAVLYQEYEGRTHYLCFYSKALNTAQKNYPATKRELLAIIYALKAFRQWLHGNHFTLYSDHKALSYLFAQKEPSYMLANWADELINFDFTIVHRPGVEMILPDGLSRMYVELKQRTGLHHLSSEKGDDSVISPRLVITQSTYIRCTACKTRASRQCEQRACARHCRGCAIHPQVVTSSSLPSQEQTLSQPLPIEQAESQPKITFSDFVKNVVNKTDPGSEDERTALIQDAHQQSHQGARNIQRDLWFKGYYWPKMLKEIELVCHSCQLCLRFNLIRNGYHPLKTINATFPLDHVAMDLFTLNHTSRSGKNYVMVITDIATRFTFLFALTDKLAVTSAQTFFQFISLFGVPKIVQADNGTEFNLILKSMEKDLGFDSRTITPRYPQSNGTAEAHVKLAKSLLIKKADGNLDLWDTFLPAVQQAINLRVSKRTKSTPFSLLFGRPWNSNQKTNTSELLTTDQLLKRHENLHDIVYPTLREVTDASNKQVAAIFKNSQKILNYGLPVGSYVMKLDKGRTKKTQPAYTGPYKVVRFTPNQTYVLEDSTGALLPRNATLSELKLIAQSAEEELGTKEFEVESILNHRGRGQKREFLIKWLGYDSTQNSWEPIKNLANAHHEIQTYLSRRGLVKETKARPKRKK